MARLTALANHLAAHPEWDDLSSRQVAEILDTADIPCYVDFDTSELRSYWIEQGTMDDLVGMLSSDSKDVRNLGYACKAIYDRQLETVRCTDATKRTAFHAIADACVALGVATAEQGAHVKAMGEGLQSWAQANGYPVITANDVGQARAGNLGYRG